MKKFLKFYVWIMTFLVPLLFWYEFTDESVPDAVDYLDFVFWIIAMVGVVAYCYEKEVFVRRFWQAYFPFIILWDLYIVYREVAPDPEMNEPTLLLIFVVIYLIMVVPEYIGLYLYAYGNDQLNDNEVYKA